jgi:hypothetical protein
MGARGWEKQVHAYLNYDDVPCTVVFRTTVHQCATVGITGALECAPMGVTDVHGCAFVSSAAAQLCEEESRICVRLWG